MLYYWPVLHDSETPTRDRLKNNIIVTDKQHNDVYVGEEMKGLLGPYIQPRSFVRRHLNQSKDGAFARHACR